MSDIIPSAELLLGKDIPISHTLRDPLIQMIVHIIAYIQIRQRVLCVLFPHMVLDCGQKFFVRLLLQPVVGIHHLIIDPLCQLHSLIHTGTVSAVSLDDSPHNVGIFSA